LKTLESYPEKLFAGQTFWLFRKIDEGWGYFYSRGLENYADLRDSIQHLRKAVVDKLPINIKPNEFFEISRNVFDKYSPPKTIMAEKLSYMAFAENGHIGGLLIINQSSDIINKNHPYDLSVIRNIMNIIFAARISSQTTGSTTIDSGNVADIAGNLINVFTGITGNVQLLHQELLGEKQNVDSANIARWLRNLEDSIAKGTTLLEETSKAVNPNSIIQEVLETNKLDVAFYPDLDLPSLTSNSSDFKSIVTDIIRASIEGDRQIRLRTSADSGRIAISIEGKIRPGFPSQELTDRALRQNIEIRLNAETAESLDKQSPLETRAFGNDKLNILVVENKQLIRDLLTDLFASIGYKFVAKSSGREAMTYLLDQSARGEAVDTVVIDMALEDITGLRLCQKIKEFDKDIHTVVISSWGVNLTANTLKNAGVDAVLFKPFRLEQLRQVLPKASSRYE
jgi:CheY-like chemotaxis protein